MEGMGEREVRRTVCRRSGGGRGRGGMERGIWCWGGGCIFPLRDLAAYDLSHSSLPSFCTSLPLPKARVGLHASASCFHPLSLALPLTLSPPTPPLLSPPSFDALFPSLPGRVASSRPAAAKWGPTSVWPPSQEYAERAPRATVKYRLGVTLPGPRRLCSLRESVQAGT